MSEKTRISRLQERQVDDRTEIHRILDEGFVCHVAYLVDGRPVVMPTLYARDGERLLLHGSNSSGLVRAVRRDSPLSVAVTHVDGLVIARSGFHSSANYRSVVAHGRGALLEGSDHDRALDLIVEFLIPGRTRDLRPPTGPERKQTSVIALPLDEVSAKARSGGPEDDPTDISSETWAGVIPIAMVTGDPIPDPVAASLGVPDYLNPYRR